MVIHNKRKQKGRGASLSVSLCLTALTSKLPSSPKHLQQPYWLTKCYWLFSPPAFFPRRTSCWANRLYFFSGTLRMGLTGCPETSVRNYHYLLRNNPEESATQLIRAGSPYPCHLVHMYWTVFPIIRYVCTVTKCRFTAIFSLSHGPSLAYLEDIPRSSLQTSLFIKLEGVTHT